MAIVNKEREAMLVVRVGIFSQLLRMTGYMAASGTVSGSGIKP